MTPRLEQLSPIPPAQARSNSRAALASSLSTYSPFCSFTPRALQADVVPASQEVRRRLASALPG
jgi:hypothetical protein